MEMNAEQKVELNESVLESFQSAGIGRLYWDRAMKLADYGKVGQRLSEGFKSGEIVEAAKSGIGIFIVGKGKDASAVQSLLCRGYVLNGIPTKLLGLPYLERMCREGGDDWVAMHRAKVLGLQGFFDPKFERAFPDDVRFGLDFELRAAVENAQKALVIQAPVPASQCVWWSDILRELVTANTICYTL